MFKLMLKLIVFAPELKSEFYLSSLFKVIESFFAGAPYGIMIMTLNDLLSGTLTMERVAGYTTAVAACFIVQGVFFYLFSRVAYPAGAKLAERIRIIVGEHLRKLSMGYFNEKTTGDLNALVADELIMVTHIPTMAFPQLITAITLPTVLSLFLFFVDWRLAFVTLSVIPIAILFFRTGQRILRFGVKIRSDSLIKISSKIIEYIQGMEVLKTFKQTGDQFLNFDSTLKKFKKDNLRMALEAVPPLLTFMALLDLGITLILFVGFYFFLSREITVLTLLIFLIIGLRIYEPIKAINYVYTLVRVTEVTIARIQQVLDTPTINKVEGGHVPKTFGIEFKNVTFRYNEKPVLDNVSFTIPEKTVTALVGPSGVGKTTITNLIARFWDVEAGEIRIGGNNIKKIETNALLSLLSMVFQDVYLFNDTIYTNIAYGFKNATKSQIIQAAKTARCHEFISKLPDGYDTMVGEGGATLSGGEKQRISIARAILKDSPIILLDEATSSLDPENEYKIQKAINALVESKTLIIIAHRLSTITAADQIIVLNNKGKVEKVGKHEELLIVCDLYKRLWESRQNAKNWKVGYA